MIGCIKHKRVLLLVIASSIFCINKGFSQVKIGTSNGTPNVGAMLEIESSNRGFLPPRINLSSATMKLNGENPLEGTIIYSTNFSGDGALGGLQLFRGGQWNRVNEDSKSSLDFIRLLQNTAQQLTGGANTTITFDAIVDVFQSSGDAAMWSSSNPSKVIIRKQGLYFIAANSRVLGSGANQERQLTILKGTNGIAGSGGITQVGVTSTIEMNASTVIYCNVNDEISVIQYNSNSVYTAASSGAINLTVAQLPLN